MAKKLCNITIRGREKTWGFHSMLDTRYLDEYRADGLEIDELVNVIPLWVARYGLVRPWCFLQDIFNFKNPFK